jgi:glutathione synthase
LPTGFTIKTDFEINHYTMKIALLNNTNPASGEDNSSSFGQHLSSLGHEVYVCPIDSLALDRGEVIVNSVPSDSVTDLHDKAVGIPLGSFALVWILGLGQRAGFLDKLQLLQALPASTRIINPLSGILHLKSKYLLNSLPDIFPQPESYASSDWRWLLSIMKDRGGTWIVKPPAGSFGRDVFKICADDANASAVLQNMTGHESGNYCLMQRYIDAISEGEKRVLFAAGHVIGQYLRFSVADHRTNLAQGAVAESCGLSSQEQVLCERIGDYLKQHCAGYVAMDMVYPYIIELNVVNPGGLSTLNSLTGTDYAGEVVKHILAHFWPGEDT